METTLWNVSATPFNFLSLGGGVQSSTMALMTAHGLIEPTPNAAIFADTQVEPRSVYIWLDWLRSEIARSPRPFPVYTVTNGNLMERALTIHTAKDGRRYTRSDVPTFLINANGEKGMIPNRACTGDFKIKPILKKVRELAGIKRGQKEITVTQWIGISWDEMQRAKLSRDKWCQNRWPLIERKMTRAMCLAWMKARGYPQPPRSACSFCPFHNDTEWRRLKLEEPEAFAQAVYFDRRLRALKAETNNFRSIPFVHPSLKPLDEVDFSNEEDRGQLNLWQDFNVECEGMCGV
ncbi:MAG: hypothetical protein LBV12_06555 [Puniceicoccales bacterium]|jgi:hypothetical protein|nr:hypothetical protein [Puniceicoccales bacterium]